MEVHARHRYISTQAPAPKKAKKKSEKTPEALVALAMALKYGHRSTLFLRCLGAKDPSWDGSKPIPTAWVPEVACGYPKGTHKTKTGNSMFDNATPSAEGVYTIEKIVYVPGKKGHTKKKGEVVHYRKVEESDIPAIKKKWPEKFA